MKKTICLLMLVLFASVALACAADEAKQPEKRMKPALLVIDIQNEFLPYMSDDDKKFSLEMINYAISMFREQGFPIIRVYHTDPGEGPKPGTEPFEFPASIKIKDDDVKVIKNFPSAFTKTDLEKILREKDRNTIFLCGLSATGCVLATYYGAMDREFDVFMLKDALLSPYGEYTGVIEDMTNAIGLRALKAMLQNAQK